MPIPTALLSSIARLAVYAAALLVLATARVPEPVTTTGVSTVRIAAPEAPAGNTAWRLVIAGILLTGVALEISRRRAVWH